MERGDDDVNSAVWTTGGFKKRITVDVAAL